MKTIPYARQDINEEDIEAVLAVLKSDYLTQGPAIERFEKTVAEYCSVPHAVAVANATAALHLACLALGVRKGDYVWTSPITFVASANCALYCGASVDFVDIDPLTWNMSLSALETKLRKAKQDGKLPKLVIAVHFTGQPCEMKQIQELSKQYGFYVIEDASHAIGAEYLGKKVGHCPYSDATVFSFHPVKIITTGEGGMLTTQNEELAQKFSRLRTHGITRDASQMTKAPDGPWYYEQLELGFNYRLSDLQAALGVNQLKRIDKFIERRVEIAKRYDQELAGLPLVPVRQHADGKSAHHLYVVRLKLNQVKRSQREIHEALIERGIRVNLHYIPVHMQPHYKTLGFTVGSFPEAEKYYGEALSLPMYYGLSDDEQTRVIEALKEVL